MFRFSSRHDVTTGVICKDVKTLHPSLEIFLRVALQREMAGQALASLVFKSAGTEPACSQ